MTVSLSPACPDFDLVRRLLSGDEAAFSDLYARSHASMVRLASLFVADSRSAEEVVQETWITVFEKLSSFEGRARLRTWVYRILVNKAKKRGMQEKREVPFTALSRASEEDNPVDPEWFLADGHWKSTPRRWEHETPERLVESQHTRDFVLGLVADLPDKERAVVRLRDLEEWSSEEVCEVLEISPVYQRVLLHRGRTRMRAALARFLDQEGSPC